MECIFCAIANHEVEAKIIHETDKVFVMHDIDPKAKVHLLAIPKEHIVTFNDITDDNKAIISELAVAIDKVTRDLGISESGYKVITNNGPDGGQAVKHLHMHIMGGEKVKGVT